MSSTRQGCACTEESTLTGVRVLGGCIGLFLVVMSVIGLITLSSFNFKALLRHFHLFVFGMLVLLAELRWDRLLNGFAFLKTYIGRGVLYIFIASVNGAFDFDLGEAVHYLVWVTFLVIGIVNICAGCCIPSARENDKTHTAQMQANQGYEQGQKNNVAYGARDAI